MTDPTSIDLKPTDAALIFREEEPQVEICIPKGEDENAVVPNHVVLAIAIGLRINEDDWVKEIMDWFDERMREKDQNFMGFGNTVSNTVN